MRKKTLLNWMLLLCALIVGSSSAWAETKTITAGTLTDGVLTDSPFTLTFAKNTGSTAPTYNTNGGDLRLYAKGTVEVSSSGGNMTQIVFNLSTQGKKRLAPITASVGSISTQAAGDETVTWTGDAESVVFTVGDQANYGSDGDTKAGQLCFSSVDITYTASAVQKVSKPTISGDDSFLTSTEVTISCGTEGAAIQYSTDGTNWSAYSAPFTLTETTTVYAKATKNGMTDSDQASKTFTKSTIMTVAQAIAAIDAGAGTTGAYATGIVSQIVTEYSAQHSNITFNMSDDGETTSAQLQAYRCGGAEAANIGVGDIVVVSGNLTKYNDTYEFASGCQIVSRTPAATPTCAKPTFSPVAGAVESGTTVTISTETEGATIYYTMGDDPADPTEQSSVYSGPIEITAATTIKAIAVKAGSKNSAVASASYTVISQQTISSITVVGTAYAVKGTVVAINAKGFVIGDGTGYVYTYLNATPTVAVGNKVSVSGTTGTYGHIIQFTNSATVAESATSNYDGTPAVTAVDADGIAAYNSDYQLSDYVQFEGALAKSGSNYNITVGTATARISYPTDDQKTTLEALVGKTVRVKGYFAGFSGSGESATFTAMFESIEELAVPTITANNVTIEAEATSGEIAYTVENPTGATLNAALTDGDWISNIAVVADKVTFDATANTGDERTAKITLSYTGAADKVVTVTQKKYVAAATLPFAFDGGKADIETTDGLSQTGLGGDYGSSPKLKFDGTGDCLVLKIDETPGKLCFDIKGNSFSGGTFTVQTSADGLNYTDLEVYTELGAVQTEKFINLESNVRYIKWIYTEKVTGNVALGNISLIKPVTSEVATVTNADWATYVTEYNVQIPAGTAYAVASVENGWASLVEVTSAPAGTPLLLMGAGEIDMTVVASANAVENNMLKVVQSGDVIKSGVYVLAEKSSKVGFYKWQSETGLSVGKVYLSIPDASREFIGISFDEATGISANNRETITNNLYYNLNGQRIQSSMFNVQRSTLKPGLYIQNGKKVLVK